MLPNILFGTARSAFQAVTSLNMGDSSVSGLCQDIGDTSEGSGG